MSRCSGLQDIRDYFFEPNIITTIELCLRRTLVLVVISDGQDEGASCKLRIARRIKKQVSRSPFRGLGYPGSPILRFLSTLVRCVAHTLELYKPSKPPGMAIVKT